MARVCVGCGLTRDEDGNLIVDVNESSWSFSECTEANGAPIYCGDDGSLRTDPRPAMRRIDVNKDRSYASMDIPDEQTDFGFTAAQGGATYRITNPSTCYTAIVDLTEIWDFDFRPTENCRIRVYTDNPYGQIFDFTNRGNATIIDMGWNVPVRRTYTLNPGQFIDITPEVRISATGGSGAVINKLQYHARGLVVAMPTVGTTITG